MSNLVPGALLSHYRILSAIGAGGMGEVYCAEDVKLERTVALKILPEKFASEADRLARFVREAKTASAINHPNVAHIYEIGEDNNTHFIAMELIDGTALDRLISNGTLKINQILEFATQIADALQAAHSRGVIHRDLKPGNIMINSAGQAKVLDFGLAKLDPIATSQAGTQLATVTNTEPGLVMGTVPYMSPEQALGRAVDARSDLFSFGSILYEMSTGRRPFTGKTSPEMIGQITHSQPLPISRFSNDVPVEFERIVRKCLEKNAEDRYQSAKELLIDLRTLKRDSVSGASPAGLQTASKRKASVKIAAGIVAVLILIAGGIGYWKVSSGNEIRSIAVLPFANSSGDEQVEYLSDGITDSTINDLSQLRQIRVIARPTVFTYKGKSFDPRQVGRELKVDGVVTGSISKQQDNLIVQADLINVKEGTEIWGGQFKRNISDILSIQSDLSGQISKNLRIHLTREERQQVTKQHTGSNEAYQLYLQGLYFWNKANEEGCRKSIQFFTKALEKDPSYSRAYSGVSDGYALLGMLGYVSPDEVWPKSKAAALKALELDPENPRAHISLGTNYMFYDQQWKDAERELLKAAANPNDAYAHHILYIYYGATGNTREALRQILLARELDPVDVLTICDTGFAYYLNHQYDKAVEYELKALEMDPNYESALFILTYIYTAMKQYGKAIEIGERAVAAYNRNPLDLAALAYALGRAGKIEQARAIFSELKERSKNTYVSPFFLGVAAVGLNQTDEAFLQIRKSCEERTGDWNLIFLKTDPLFDPLRSDPRFADLLKCMNLP